MGQVVGLALCQVLYLLQVGLVIVVGDQVGDQACVLCDFIGGFAVVVIPQGA